jgi:hypothetical protein
LPNKVKIPRFVCENRPGVDYSYQLDNGKPDSS